MNVNCFWKSSRILYCFEATGRKDVCQKGWMCFPSSAVWAVLLANFEKTSGVLEFDTLYALDVSCCRVVFYFIFV